MRPADPRSPASNGTVTEPSAPRTAIIIPFPDPRARAPSHFADTLVRAAATLSESAEQLHRQSRNLEAWRGGFDQAKAQLVVESDRARAIASDGARIAAAIERGDLAGLEALRREIEARVKAGIWPR